MSTATSAHNASLTKREETAEGTMAFHFAKPADFEFRPGQSMDVTLLNPPETDAEGNSRTFSIASAPFDNDLMIATRMRDTAFKRVLRKAAPGLQVKIDGPSGSFVLHRKSEKPAVFLAGGIGITPFVSIIRQAGHDKSPHHVYEPRLYHVNEGKMDALKARFGDHTDSIFKRHNMKSIGYWSPEDAPSSQNLFIYILEYPSRQEAEKNWAAFQADPEWQKVKAESEKNGPLVDHIDRYFMDPTSYSALN